MLHTAACMAYAALSFDCSRPHLLSGRQVGKLIVQILQGIGTISELLVELFMIAATPADNLCMLRHIPTCASAAWIFTPSCTLNRA